MYIKKLIWCTVIIVFLSGCKTPSAQMESSTSGKRQIVSSVNCSKDVPEPFTAPLTIQSKYNQSDKSKSTQSTPQNRQSINIQKTIIGYTRGIVRFGNYAINSDNAAKQAGTQRCLHVWLTAWANAGALTTNDTTKTGIVVRKWTLASIAMVAIKTEQLSQGTWALNSVEKQWFSNLAALVINDYNARLVPYFKYFNNHDHWAAWAIFSTGMLVDNQDFIRWGKRVFDIAFTRAVFESGKQYAYFPNEISRRQLAANYTHFSLALLASQFCE